MVDYTKLQELKPGIELFYSGKLGTTWGADLEKLPLSLQFYAGGAQSIRGYAYHNFGPGRFLKHLSIEIRKNIKKNLSLSAFTDAGTADNSITAKLHYASGLGLIWRSAIGAFKLSLAHPVREINAGWRIQFSITQALDFWFFH